MTMWHHPDHMIAGKAAAAKSHKTPAHLKPHLQSQVNNMKKGTGYLKGLHAKGSPTGGVALKARGGQSAPIGNSPTTAQPKFKPPAKIGGGTAMDDGSTGQAEQQIAAAPLPFQNPKAAANLPAPANQRATMNVGTGKGANMSGVKGSKAPVHPPTAPTGGYKPKKNHPPSGMSRFYGTK